MLGGVYFAIKNTILFQDLHGGLVGNHQWFETLNHCLERLGLGDSERESEEKLKMGARAPCNAPL